MTKGGKIKEVEQLVNMEGEKGFLTFDEASELPPTISSPLIKLMMSS
jgi:hypothetical protein